MTPEQTKRLIELCLKEIDAVWSSEGCSYGLSREDTPEFIRLVNLYVKENNLGAEFDTIINQMQ